VGVNLYTWNRVSVYRVNQLGGLSVNGGRPVHGHSSGQLTELNLPMSVYVGGYPANYNRQARLTSGFHGAIQRVRFFAARRLGRARCLYVRLSVKFRVISKVGNDISTAP